MLKPARSIGVLPSRCKGATKRKSIGLRNRPLAQAHSVQLHSAHKAGKRLSAFIDFHELATVLDVQALPPGEEEIVEVLKKVIRHVSSSFGKFFGRGSSWSAPLAGPCQGIPPSPR